MTIWSRGALAAVASAVLGGVAIAQGPDGSAAVQTPPPASAAPPAFTAPPLAAPPPMSTADVETLREGLSAARSGDFARAQLAQTTLANPIARKIVLWAIIDSMPDRLPFAELDQARRDLWAWPHRAGRQIATEKQLEAAALGPQKTIDWFEGSQPISPEGAMALAAAYQAAGRPDDAKTLIRHFWREKSFEEDQQRIMLARFGADLTMDDHIRRADTLLFGQQGPAASDMIQLLPPDQQALADARMGLRADAENANALYEAVPASLAHDPGLAVERARWLLARGEGAEALPLLADFPAAPGEDAAPRIWSIRRQLVNVALQAGDAKSAYLAVDKHGLKPGAEAADAEFLAGWIALDRLHDPALAEPRFAALEKIGASPITQSRALYWLGRVKEAMGDADGAREAYGRAAQFDTTFYGQLAAGKAGQTELALDKDPVPSPADRARFEGREIIQAARILADVGEQPLFNTLVIGAADTLPNVEECALLVDLARRYDEQDLSMRVVRLCAQRGFILPERGYPLRSPPGSATVEAAMVLGIIRQESGFDPHVRSGAGARGMMQLMPATAKVLAKRAGMTYAVDRLDDADYNMTLGADFLGDLVNRFDGSYVMAAAAYNAGPGRPTQWTEACGDPRGSSTDPVDYIECIPISETRNYVMRVLEGMQVYRARLNGGRAPLTLAADLKRGGYGSPGAGIQLASNGPTIDSLLEGSLGAAADSEAVVASTPVPNPPETEHGKPEDKPVKGKAAGKAAKGHAAARGRAEHGAKGHAARAKGHAAAKGRAAAKGAGKGKTASSAHSVKSKKKH